MWKIMPVMTVGLLLLGGCVKHTTPLMKLPDMPLPKKSSAYLYDPPKIHRTYITAHVDHNGLVEGSHYVYWAETPGHWHGDLNRTEVLKNTLIEPNTPDGES